MARLQRRSGESQAAATYLRFLRFSEMARLCFLVCFIGTCSFVSGQSPTYRLKGLEVSLKPHITGQPDEILWKHNGNKVIEFGGRQEDVYGRYKNRVTLDWISAELNIENLSYEDSGEYELEMYTNKMLSRESFKLKVIDKVVKPTISCMRNSTHGKQAELICSAESRHPETLKYEWISHQPVQLGQILKITLGDEHDNQEYTCLVSNPLTNERAKFTAKDCYPDEGPPLALIVSLSIAIGISILAMVVVIICCKLNHKACFANDLEKTPGSREGSNNEAAQDAEYNPLLHRTPTVPSGQRLTILPQSKSNMNHTEDIDLYQKDVEDEMLQEGTVRKHISQFECNRNLQTLFQETPTGLDKNADREKTLSPPSPPGRKPSVCEGSDNVPSSDKGDADTDQLKEPDSSDSEEDSLSDPSDALKFIDDLQPSPAPEQPGSNNEAAQNAEYNPLLHRTPTVPSGQQFDHNNDPDRNHTEDIDLYQEDVEDEMLQEEPEKKADEDGEEKSPPANGVSPPIPKPRLRFSQ